MNGGKPQVALTALRDLVNTGIFVVECSNEDSGFYHMAILIPVSER